MIQSITNYYNSPDSCPFLCAPLKKYQELFVEKREEAEGCSKIALTVAWLATAIFAYPIFGLLALIGAGLSFATLASLEPLSPLPDFSSMSFGERDIWQRVATTEEWNEAQIVEMRRVAVSISPRIESRENFTALLEAPGYLHHDSYNSENSSEDSLSAVKERVSAQVRFYTQQNIKVDIEGADVLDEGRRKTYFILFKSEEEEPLPTPLAMTPGELQIWKKIATVEEWNKAQIDRFLAEDQSQIPFPIKTHLEEGEEASLQKNCLYFECIDATNNVGQAAEINSRIVEKASSFTEYKIDIEILVIRGNGCTEVPKAFIFIRKSS